MGTSTHSDEVAMPSQIAYRAMSSYTYAKVRYERKCPIGRRMMKIERGGLKYRPVGEMPEDDLTNLLRLVSDPCWMWRKGSNEDEDEFESEETSGDSDSTPRLPKVDDTKHKSPKSEKTKTPKGSKK